MLVEIYKGVKIEHDAAKDVFMTNLVLVNHPRGRMGKIKDEFVTEQRLQACRNSIDKILNASTKRPVLVKGWFKARGSHTAYEKCTIIYYSLITHKAMIQIGSQFKEVALNDHSWNDDYVYLDCKENNAIIAEKIKIKAQIEKLEKSVSCSKLIPLKLEHFTK